MEIEYLTNKNGQQKAVVVPIDLWRKIFRKDDTRIEEMEEAMEDYCLDKAMDEAKSSPILSRDEALKFLEKNSPQRRKGRKENIKKFILKNVKGTNKWQ